MPEISPNQKPANILLWIGLIVTVLAVLSNLLYYLDMPQAIIPWINLLLPLIGLYALIVGVKRAFKQPQVYSGKIWGSIVTLVAVAFFCLSVFGAIHARDLPRSKGAPRVGQKVPDFTLTDTKGQTVSLSQLLSSPVGNSARPKAILLVFYRGYW